MNSIQIAQPEIQDLQESSKDLMFQVDSLVVKDEESYIVGGKILLEIQKVAKVVETRFAEPVSLAHKAHKAMTALRDSILDPFKLREKTIKSKLGTYQMEIEQKRKEDAARLLRQAEAQAEADKIAKAEAQMDKGDLKGCEATLAAPIVPVRVPAAPEAPKLSGVTFRDVWKFEITNVNEIPLDYMVPDEGAIGKVVRALGGKTNIPGVRVWNEKVVTGRQL